MIAQRGRVKRRGEWHWQAQSASGSRHWQTALASATLLERLGRRGALS